MNPLDRKALKRSVWSSLSRVIGIGLSVGAGSMIHTLLGDGIKGWGVAVTMALASFLLMCFAEYERETNN